MIEPSTCRRDAPSVRSVASSRVRCAIVIESEFAITNEPTKSAIPPNASRKPWRNVMNSFVSSASASRLLAAGLDLRARPGGSSSICETSSCSVASGFAATAISSSCPSFSHQPLRGREVEAGERRAADREPGAELDDPRDPAAAAPAPPPGRRSSRRPRSPPCAAVSLSTTTSFGPGQSPSTSVSGLNGELGFAIEKPRFGAPP